MIKTNNFKMLEHFDLSGQIKGRIAFMEEKIAAKDYEGIFKEGRFILEELLYEELQQVGLLGKAIKMFNDTYIVPSNVRHAMYYVNAKSNTEHHFQMQNEKSFDVNKDVISTIEFMKNLFSIIKWFISRKFDEELTAAGTAMPDYQFDWELYFRLSKIKVEKPSELEHVKVDSHEMTTEMKGIFQLITSNYQFLIPTYQRSYSWKPDNVETFLQDIHDRMNDGRKHYFGSLAITIDSETKQIRLIDGQQRITTSLLFIRAAIDVLTQRKMELPQELQMIKEELSKKYKNSNTSTDLTHVNTILLGHRSSSDDFKASKAWKNYERMKLYLNPIAVNNRLDEYITCFIHQFIIAELKFENSIENEIQIFENLNSKGMELSQWDLVKNYIFKNIEPNFLSDNEKQIMILLNEMFVIRSSESFPNEKEKQLSTFVTYFNRLESVMKNNNVLYVPTKTHKDFASIWPDDRKIRFSNAADLRESLTKMSGVFEIYCEIKTKKFREPSSLLYPWRLHIENYSSKDVFLPLIMHIIYQASEFDVNESNETVWTSIKDTSELDLLLPAIDKYVTRMLIVHGNMTVRGTWFDECIQDGIGASYKVFVKRIRNDDSAASLPMFKDFKSSFNGKDDWTDDGAISVLRTYEFNKSKENNIEYKLLSSASLDMISPEKDESDSWWYAQYDSTFGVYKNKRKNSVKKIGNYIIVNKKLTTTQRNLSLSEKNDIYIKKATTPFLRGAGSDELIDLTVQSSFKFEDIDERTKQLSTSILKYYKFDFER